MESNYKFISPQMWWIVDVGLSCAIEREDATQAQKKCLHLDCQATNILHHYMKDNIFGEIMDMKSAHEIWTYLIEKYEKVPNIDDDVSKLVAHEDVEHDYNSVIVEDCSTSWSSDEDDLPTTRSLDKDDEGPTSSVAIDDATPSTLDDDDDACSGYESDASTSSSTSSHCFM